MSYAYDIIVIGAGPAGLACALEALRRGLQCLVVEKGAIVNTIVGFPTSMTFFSTADLLELGDMPFTSPQFRPSRIEAIEYYTGVVRKGNLSVSLHNRVETIVARGDGTFEVRAELGEYVARFVVIATGYFDHTNMLGVPGEDLSKVHHYYTEPYEHYGSDVLVIGGRNSAAETALDLYRHGAHVTIVHRGEELSPKIKYWIRPDLDNRIKKGDISLMLQSEVVEIRERTVVVRYHPTEQLVELANDVVYAMIGYRPDAKLLADCGVAYDPETLIPAYDPSTFETNVPNLFIAGSVACGCKTWEIFIENGRQHALSVVAEIARRMQSPSHT